MSLSPEARERHRLRALPRRAKERAPKPFKPPRGRKGLPDWVTASITAIWTYVFSPSKFPELEKINNLYRTKNLVRRIAIAKVLQVMFYHKDTLTLWVAYPDKNTEEFKGRGVRFLARETELTESAVKGALKDLRAAKFIETYRRRARLADGTVGYAPAIRLMRRALFEMLGVAHRLNEARKDTANKLIAKMAPLIETGKFLTSWSLLRFEVAQNILLDPTLNVTPISALLP